MPLWPGYVVNYRPLACPRAHPTILGPTMMCELKRDLEEFGDWGVGSGMVNLDLESFRGRERGKSQKVGKCTGCRSHVTWFPPLFIALSCLNSPRQSMLL